MEYKAARPLIASGDIIAFTHKGWGSRGDLESQIVRIATRSEFSHVGISWVVAARVFILEAVVPRVRIFPLSNFDTFYWLSMCRPLSGEAEERALALVGQGYSKWEAVKALFGSNKLDARWQCAEYVKEVLRANRISLTGLDTPSAVVQSAMENFNVALTLVTK